MRFYIVHNLKLFFIFILLFGCAGCTSVNQNSINQNIYDSKEFETENYQKNIDEATDIAMLFNNMDVTQNDTMNISDTTDGSGITDTAHNHAANNIAQTAANLAILNSQDLAMLLQADFYFNQDDYVRAAPLYEKLSYKYKAPKIIYMAIICIGRLSPTQSQMMALNRLINMFIQSAPQSQLATLFKIRVGINTNNIKLAETNLDKLINKNINKARAIILFVSSMISTDVTDVSADNTQTVSQFINYVESKYGEYPESHLLTVVGNAAIANTNELRITLHKIYYQYPTWKVPLYWSIGVLALHKNNYAIVDIVGDALGQNGSKNQNNSSNRNQLDNHGQNVQNTITGSHGQYTLAEYLVLQNIYIAALLNTRQDVQAKSYLLMQLNIEKSAKNNPEKNNQSAMNNILLNLGIIETKLGNYVDAVMWLKQVILLEPSQSDLVSLLIATIYDYQGQYNDAILYATKVNHDKYLISIAHVLLLNDYYALRDMQMVDSLLVKIATNQKLNKVQMVLLKAAYYNERENYQKSYDLLSSNISGIHNMNISKNSTVYQNYLYQYAVASAMLNKTSLAISLYKEYIRLYPKSPYGYNDLAYVYSNQTTDYKTALKYANLATKITPLDPNVLDTLGWIYYKLGQYDKAYIYIENSYVIMQNSITAKHLQDVLIALKKPIDANKIVITNKLNEAKIVKIEIINKTLNILMYMSYGVEIK
jgi:uncharacterized protein HemY